MYYRYHIIFIIMFFAPMAALAVPNDARNGVPSDTGTSVAVTQSMETKERDASAAPPKKAPKLIRLHKHRKKQPSAAATEPTDGPDAPPPAEQVSTQ